MDEKMDEEELYDDVFLNYMAEECVSVLHIDEDNVLHQLKLDNET